MDIIKCALQHFVGDFARLQQIAATQFTILWERVQNDKPVPPA